MEYKDPRPKLEKEKDILTTYENALEKLFTEEELFDTVFDEAEKQLNTAIEQAKKDVEAAQDAVDNMPRCTGCKCLMFNTTVNFDGTYTYNTELYPDDIGHGCEDNYGNIWCNTCDVCDDCGNRHDPYSPCYLFYNK